MSLIIYNKSKRIGKSEWDIHSDHNHKILFKTMKNDRKCQNNESLDWSVLWIYILKFFVQPQQIRHHLKAGKKKKYNDV